MVSSERSNADLTEYTLFQILKIFLYPLKSIKNKKLYVFFAVLHKIIQKFSDFINSDDFIPTISDYNQFLLKEKFEVIRK